ncbi:hypothetical protein SAMN04487965_2130 [Microbulbifer donghaiensis]|uniref:Glutathionylspermidine synthase preATP-grasp n=1 Tax=Microbulbifer donghaiensis TaxID=494016 RepID=A0A1M5CB18_9GAMM|nr:hypothetical protein [Microbulbifer donghaiensis]SHF51964.1 hypothetical protein SAMN04487965_2130 [Microbulbifer donghaiensis]
MSETAANFLRQLHNAEPPLPDYFTVAQVHQSIPQTLLAEIDDFINLFERVSRRRPWTQQATEGVPAIAHSPRREVCFFSAWDFHLPPDRPGDWQLIEFNDNGSGLLFAAQINRSYYDHFLADDGAIRPPPRLDDLHRRVLEMIEREARTCLHSDNPDGVLILDERDSLQKGRFREELMQLAALCRAQGWRAHTAAPEDLTWDAGNLLVGGEPVSFVVNRSTDFFWQADKFTALREAYGNGRVYIAPNPFSYATRSDKRLLDWLSRPDRDTELGITSDERELLSRHVPPTWELSEDNLDALAARKLELVFKPARSHAGLGVLDSRDVGRHRLRRLLSKGECYVAQRRVGKGQLLDASGNPLWADLRVWSWRGQRYLISGRASRQENRLDLEPPGGWLPTFEQVER